MTVGFIRPDWPAPTGVEAVSTLRAGGTSPGPWASMNLGGHVGDDPTRVAANRHRLAQALDLPGEPAWLDQVHGTAVLRLDGAGMPEAREADGAVTGRPGRPLAVLTADCLPVVFCRRDGGRVGIAHAGWRGLAAGVLEAAAEAMDAGPSQLMAWLGPCIGPGAYEVGPEVREAFAAAGPGDETCFTPARRGHWLCDLTGLARRRLARLGITATYGGGWCTASDPEHFFSHRRDGKCGRMATLVWISG